MTEDKNSKQRAQKQGERKGPLPPGRTRKQREDERKAGFKTLVLGLLVLVLVAIWWDKSDEIPLDSGKKETTQVSPKKTGDAPKAIKGPPLGWIKRAYFSFPKREKGTALKVNVETRGPVKENQHFSYIYWKNGQKLEEKSGDSGDTLEGVSYKNGDVIFADVVLYQDGQVLESKRSEMVRVGNSSPVIDEVAIPKIFGPGAYEILVKARDADKDKLTFSLETEPKGAALPPGIQLEIDKETGTVTCTLGDNPPDQLKFIIVADDGNKGTAKKIVTIPLKRHQMPGGDNETGQGQGDG